MTARPRTARDLDRDDVVVTVLTAAREYGAAVFTSNGNNSRAAYHLADDPSIFYAMGSMGQCSLLAAGFARRAGRPVLAVDGDGAVAMGAAGLPMAAGVVGVPLVHVVVDNGCFGTTGGQPVPVPDGWLDHLARGAGYRDGVSVGDEAALSAAVRDAFAHPGATLIRAHVLRHARAHYPRVALDPAEVTRRFVAHWRV